MTKKQRALEVIERLKKRTVHWTMIRHGSYW